MQVTADRCGSEARFPQLSGVGEALSPEESKAKVALHPSPWQVVVKNFVSGIFRGLVQLRSVV